MLRRQAAAGHRLRLRPPSVLAHRGDPRQNGTECQGRGHTADGSGSLESDTWNVETRQGKRSQAQQGALHLRQSTVFLIGQSPERGAGPWRRRQGWECESKMIAPGTSWHFEVSSNLPDCGASAGPGDGRCVALVARVQQMPWR